MGVVGQGQAPAALPPGKTRYHLYRRLSESQGRTGQVRKISPPTVIRFPDHPDRSLSLYQLHCSGPASEANVPKITSKFSATRNQAPFQTVSSHRSPSNAKLKIQLNCSTSFFYRRISRTKFLEMLTVVPRNNGKTFFISIFGHS